MTVEKRVKKKACFGCRDADLLYRWSPLGFLKVHCAVLDKDINEQSACIAEGTEKKKG
jgi:hypothetical protein